MFQAVAKPGYVPELRRRTIMKFANRMNRFGEGVFSRLAEMKRQRLEAGESVLDLSIGAPNIPTAKHILDVLCKEAADKNNYIYAINDQKDLGIPV